MVAEFRLQTGFTEDQRASAAKLFWSAFRGKLETVLGPEARALRLLEAVMDPDYAFSATAPDGTLLGIAGYKTEEGAFVGGTFRQLRAVYGLGGAIWRGLLLQMLERNVESGVLLMDGVFVSEQARGQGVGSALLKRVFEKAAESGLKRVRLDVIDTNQRARSLYERMGFAAVSEEKMGPLRHVFGFETATRMEKIIASDRQ